MNKKIQKGQNTAAIPEVLGAKPGYCTGSLHTGPPKGWAHRHLSYPCGSACQSAPLHSPHMRNSLLTPLLSPASKQGHVLLVFAPSWCSHKKALPEFLLWPLTSLCGLESKGPVQSSRYSHQSAFPLHMIATVLTSSNIDEFCLPFTLCEWN